jgi:hypothetical protein
MPNQTMPDLSRREGVSARLIRLADGNDWGFSRPTVRLIPKVITELDRLGRPVERITVEIAFGYPLDVQRLIDGVRSACECGSVSQQYEAFFSMATAILLRVHEISRATACELLAVSEHDLPRLVQEIMAVVSETDRTSETNNTGGTVN